MADYNDLAYSLAGVQRKNPYDRKRTFAQRLQAMGGDASPVDHPLQGAARLAQALVGGWMGGQADRDEQASVEKGQKALAAAMAEPDPQKRIAMLGSADPALGARLSGQMAIEQAKIGQQQTGLQAGAGGFGSAYSPQGGPPQGPPSAMTPPLPQGQPAPGGFNNNLGNIRATPINWQGKGAPQNGFETFGTPQQGADAMVKNLGAYIQRNPNITVAQAIAQWAPPNENNTDLYIRQVAEGTGINPGMPLAEVLQDPAVAAQLLDAMTRKEKGGLPQGVNADTFMNATTPGGQQPQQPGQPLTINMGGPGQIPQGDAMPGQPPAPNPGVVGGPAVIAPPSVPEVPRPQPSREKLAQYQQRISSGEFGQDAKTAIPAARAALEAELDRDWQVARERSKMQFDQQSKGYTEARKPTEAQKAVDATFGKEYADWVAGGGASDTRKQIIQLEEVLGKLKSDASLTGPVIGNTPDALLNIFNPDAIAARNAVEEVVQRNLRLVLGAQFTEKEGERLIARAYNPSLREEENAKRVERLLEQIKSAAAAKVSAAQYYEQNGTLRGWSGKLPTVADFNPEPVPQPDNGPPTPGAVEGGYRFRGGNPADRNSWERVQ